MVDRCMIRNDSFTGLHKAMISMNSNSGSSGNIGVGRACQPGQGRVHMVLQERSLFRAYSVGSFTGFHRRGTPCVSTGSQSRAWIQHPSVEWEPSLDYVRSLDLFIDILLPRASNLQ